jgi:hypothetical protein
MPFARAPALALLLGLVGTSAQAAVVLRQSIEELAVSADVIVRAEVGGAQAQWDAASQRVWTYTELIVVEALKGARVSSVLVRQPGGVVEGFGQRVPGAGQFRQGEEVVVFLQRTPAQDDSFLLLGMASGKVTLEVGADGKRRARRDLRGVEQYDPAGRPGRIRPVDDEADLGEAAVFLDRVRAAVAKGGRAP